jgi:NhaA family Na+:H+ antiporter
MRTHASSHHLVSPVEAGRSPFTGAIGFLNDRFLWLPIGALVAVLWANVDPERYFRVAHGLAFPVNEIGMALFLALLVHEGLEAVRPGGALRHWHHWTLSLVSAAGGVAGAAFAFLAYVTWRGEEVLVMAWPVAAAVDIAAGYYVLRLVYRRGSEVFPFLLVSGIAANTVGLVVLALWPAFTPEHVTGAVIVLSAVGLAAALRVAGVRRTWPFLLLAGGLSWWGFYLAGVHPALALVPIVPLLPHSGRLLEPFARRPAGAAGPDDASWITVVQVVLFFFGLVNAGAIVRGYDTGTLAVVLGALVGRPAGMMAAVALGRIAGLRLPAALTWRDLTVIALATSSGFTFALFTAATLLPVGGVLTQIRVGALATAVGAAIAYGVARWLRVGRFAAPQ